MAAPFFTPMITLHRVRAPANIEVSDCCVMKDLKVIDDTRFVVAIAHGRECGGEKCFVPEYVFTPPAYGL